MKQSGFQVENKTSKTVNRLESDIHKDTLLKHIFSIPIPSLFLKILFIDW